MIDGKMDSQEFAVWSSFFRAAFSGVVSPESGLMINEDMIASDAEAVADAVFELWDKRRKAYGLR